MRFPLRVQLGIDDNAVPVLYGFIHILQVGRDSLWDPQDVCRYCAGSSPLFSEHIVPILASADRMVPYLATTGLHRV